MHLPRIAGLVHLALATSALAGCADAFTEAPYSAPPRLPSIELAVTAKTPALAQVPRSIHPVVRAMPRSAETSIGAVARYIAAREPDRRLRIKALHDWVADRISYDVDAARRTEDGRATWPSGPYASPELRDVERFRPRAATLVSPCDADPARCAAGASSGGAMSPELAAWTSRVRSWSELADRAFAERRAVCAGYAALLHALGEAIGEDIPIVVGEASATGLVSLGRSSGRHAWNVAQTGQGYEPIDATWDAGNADGARFVAQYSTTWLFPPAGAFAATHVAEGEGEGRLDVHVYADSSGAWTRDPRFAFPSPLARAPSAGAE